MKKHILYQRNHKGQYYAGISQTKAALFLITLIIVGVGITYSVTNARTTRRHQSVPQEAEKTTYIEIDKQVFSGCSESRQGAMDCTDTATKIRIYELTEKGTKQIKWYGSSVKATVTAYTSRVEETDASPCIAADGSDICARYAKGERICASNDYKLGTSLDIQGLGRCVVSDRMNRRYTGTGRVDYYMGHDLKAARQWGAKQTSISLIE